MFMLGRTRPAPRGRCTVCRLAMRVEAQQGTVAGRITDAATGQPLGAVWVQVVGTSIAGQSAEQGTYAIRLSTGTYQYARTVGYAAPAASAASSSAPARPRHWTGCSGGAYTLEGVV